MIPELLEDLKRDEGWVPHAYEDHLGYLTIGYGFLIDERRGGELPREVAEEWLRKAASERWWKLCKLEPWLLSQPEDVQRAIANMAYQLGVNGVRGFTRMLGALRANDRERAAQEALDSKWATQTPERAKRVTDLIRG